MGALLSTCPGQMVQPVGMGSGASGQNVLTRGVEGGGQEMVPGDSGRGRDPVWHLYYTDTL